MPQMKKMVTPPPPEPPKRKSSGIVGRTGFQSQIKKDPAARKRPILSAIYGEEVLKPLINKEKEIVVAFHPFTKNNLRISTDGKFIIERFSVEETHTSPDGESLLIPASHWNLFYFKESIKDFTPPNSLEEFKGIEYSINVEECERFNDFSAALDLTNKIVELVRAEYFEEKQKKKDELLEQEKKLREDEEKLKEEEENAKNTANENSIG